MESAALAFTSSTTIVMDPRIWRHLPQGLVDRVLAFLPAAAFFRFRAVCRRFYALLFSDSFLELHLRLHPASPSFAFFPVPPFPLCSSSSPSPSSSSSSSSAAALFLLDPNANTWLRLPLAGLLPPGFSPAASSAGLLLFLSDAPGSKTLLLCNPLSKIAARLPPTPTPRLFPTVGLAAGPASLTAVVAGDDLISPFAVKNLTAEAFHADGETGFYSPWATASPLPRLCHPDPPRMAAAGDRFYCMSSGPYAVLVYDVGCNEWRKIQPPMRRFLRSPSLVDCGGGRAVILVAAVEKSRLSVPRSVRMWALQPCGRAWAEVDRMPPDVHRQFSDVEAGRGFECVGSGDYIAVAIKGSADVLLFDFPRKEWRWAAPCQFVHGGGGLRGFAYEPRLATPSIGLLDSSSSIPLQGLSGQ